MNYSITKHSTAQRRVSAGRSLKNDVAKLKAISSKKRFPCPLCNGGASRPKDLVRHMTTICDVKEEFRCPDCTKGPFYRRDRFQRHHKKDHPCSDGTCPHADQVRLPLRPRDNFGCGICRSYFSEPNKYVNHICRHYEQEFGHYWTRSQMIDSLLHQLEVRPIWYELASIRFGSSDSRNWPNLYWDDDTIDHFLPMLERRPSEEWLRLQLPILLDSCSFEQPATTGAAPAHECATTVPGRDFDMVAPVTIPPVTSMALPLAVPPPQYPCYDLFAPRWIQQSMQDTQGLLSLAHEDINGLAFASQAAYTSGLHGWAQ